MSIFLIYAEMPNLTPKVGPQNDLTSFPIRISVPQRPRLKVGIAISDGVAADRILAFSPNPRAKEGAKLRTALIDFVRERLRTGARVFLCFKAFRSRIATVKLDIRSADRCSLRQLRRKLNGMELSKIVEVVP
jgi:hypothetical protein